MTASRKLFWGAVAAVLLGAALFYATPYLSLWRLHRAVESADAQAVSNQIDFESLRESVRSKVAGQITRNAPQGAVAGLGQALALTAANQMVDALVSPEGVQRLLDGRQALAPLAQVLKPAEPQAPAVAAGSAPAGASGSTPATAHRARPTLQEALGDARRIQVRYLDWSHVQVQLAEQPGALILRREGLWGWRVAAIDWPADLALPTRR